MLRLENLVFRNVFLFCKLDQIVMTNLMGLMMTDPGEAAVELERRP